MMVPTIHLNGTSREELLGGLIDAMEALRVAMRAVTKTAPNMRDYYVQEEGNFAAAVAEHRARIQKLREIFNELNAVVEAIQAR